MMACNKPVVRKELLPVASLTQSTRDWSSTQPHEDIGTGGQEFLLRETWPFPAVCRRTWETFLSFWVQQLS